MVPYYDYGVDYKWTPTKLVILWNYNLSGKIIILYNSQ
jgi:hypothetical protein